MLSNEKSKNESKKKGVLRNTGNTQEHQRMKYLTKEVQALYTENYRALLSKTKDLNKWRDISGPELEDSLL